MNTLDAAKAMEAMEGVMDLDALLDDRAIKTLNDWVIMFNDSSSTVYLIGPIPYLYITKQVHSLKKEVGVQFEPRPFTFKKISKAI